MFMINILVYMNAKANVSNSFQFKLKHIIKKMLQFFSRGRNAEDNSYTPEDFLFRWKKLERVLAKEGVDGLLIATGLDARECIHSAYLFNWLFLGLSGKSITINKYLDPIYSQLFVIVSPKGSQIFITPQAYEKLQNLISCIPNCTVFCPTDKQYENKERLDLLKIAQFYLMTQKITKMGVFLGENEDVKVIEKWPLIQSYALEPVGRTFFTLKHQVANVSARISPLFRNLDKHSLKNLVSQTAYSMDGHVRGALTVIEFKAQEERQKITETLLQQSLQEAVDIGLFESGNQKNKASVRVLFGARTQSAQASSETVSIGSQKAEHLTVEHFDPYTKMKVWRTYFLNINVKEIQKVVLEQKEQSESFLVRNVYTFKYEQNPSYLKQSTLVSLYVSLVQSVLESIASVSKDYRNLNNDFIGKLVLSRINATAKEIYGSETFTANDIICEIESFDSFGEPRPIDFKDSISFKLTSTFYIIKLKLKNIVCPTTKQKLGAVVFSETFLIQEGCYLLLTKNTPYFDFWKCQPLNNILEELNPNFEFESLGKALSDEGFKNRIFVPSQKLSSFHLNIPILQVKYYFHEKGLRIYNEKIGWQIILYSDIHDLTMVNRIPGQWVLMKTNRSFVFDTLENNILAVEFKGKPFEFLMKQLKSKQNPLQLTFIEEIPPLLSENWYFCQEVLKKNVKDGAVLFQNQILINDYLWSFIEAKQLMIINQLKDIKMHAFKSIYQTKVEKKKQNINAPQDKHSILIINGSYGSGKYHLAKSLKRFGPNEVQLEIFRVPSDNLFKKIPVQSFLQILQEHIRENEIPLNKTIIVILPSWINNAQILPLLQSKYHIRSVLTKINASNFFSTKNRQLTENVLTFCLPGFSQNIVVDAFAEEQSLINQVMKIVGSFNKESNIFRSTNNLLTTGQCSDIVLNTSFTGQYQTFLRQKYGAFYYFDLLSDLQVNYIQFRLPLHDLSDLKKLTKTEGYLIDIKSIIRELQHKKIEAQNSKDELMIGLYQLEQIMTVVRRRQKVTQIRSIKAVAKFQEEQNKPTKIIQFGWANGQFREEQLKSNSRPLGFSIVSRRYNELQVRNFVENLSYKKVIFGEVQTLRSIDSLSKEDIQNIEKWAIENKKYLPPGYDFDGYVLRNEDGFAVDSHPNLQAAIEGWIAEENARATKFNAQLRAKWNDYVANYKE